jgi:hypothetical protein
VFGTILSFGLNQTKQHGVEGFGQHALKHIFLLDTTISLQSSSLNTQALWRKRVLKCVQEL